LGIFFCFFGENFLKVSEVIAGGAAVLVIVLYFAFNYVTINTDSALFWVVLVLAVVLGCLAGYFMTYFTWLPGIVFGGLFGFAIGFVIFNVALRYIQSNPTAVFWCSIGACIILGCVIGFIWEEEISIISTSVVGAYAIIRGISIMAGGFPDERQVYELAQKGEWGQVNILLTPIVYAYLAGFAVLATVGMIIQFKYFYEGREEKRYRRDEERLERHDTERDKLVSKKKT